MDADNSDYPMLAAVMAGYSKKHVEIFSTPLPIFLARLLARAAFLFV